MSHEDRSASIMNQYPNLKSFEIEVTETWTEADVFKTSSHGKYTSIDSLTTVYPDNTDHQSRSLYGIDLESLLRSCYHLGLKERKKTRAFPSNRGDHKDGFLRAECRIEYFEDPKPLNTVEAEKAAEPDARPNASETPSPPGTLPQV